MEVMEVMDTVIIEDTAEVGGKYSNVYTK